jgi:hypothetical protein
VDQVVTRARCVSCRMLLPFSDWKQGEELCAECRRPGTFATVPLGPPARARPDAARPRKPLAQDGRHERQILDDIPDSLIEELAAALEAEAASRPSLAAATRSGGSLPAAVQDFVDEIGAGKDPRELPWAAWGFAIGFGANVVLAKYVQMTTGAPFMPFIVPLIIGGLVAGTASAGIGWGLARLRAR